MSTETPSSTLFVSGLHQEMSEGDFAQFFQGCEGVQGTRLRYDRNDNLVGFVDFDNDENAIAVRSRFDDGKFPSLTSQGLDVHYARPTRNRGDGNNQMGGRSSRGGNSRDFGGSPNSRRNQGGFGGDRNNNNNNNNNNDNGNYNSGRGGRGGNQGNAYNYPSNYGGYGGGPYSGVGGGSNIVLPPDASSTLYVEGVAHDATDREVSHIFRPFPGFQTVRTFTRESRKYPDSTYLLCFVEFDNKHLATNAMQMLQGYKFDLSKLKEGSSNRGLRISYAAQSTKQKNRGNGGNDDQQGGNNEEEN